ncbi:hypothetical protein [Listeria booriae]|uniref:Uncharacterized protein n=1 Tax=Listeria booriae TaxID=1552123 RepID=A0A842A2N2_9LIST|nr:hypothetical protein [Listeria booriae]MBC1567206.1 hypothetical protein [Listeria booriae]MBC2164860.1 hypothetical protein [Listeria booriae]MBC2174792.1 hypothetical protein [Listeria booriae]
MDRKAFIEYGNKHLLTTTAARHITEQTTKAFQQSVKSGHLTPAFEFRDSERHVIRLYFRDEVEAYKAHMKDWQAARKK